MAKLTNVKTLDMENGEITKIQFDGEEYQYISDRAVEGDIGLVVDAWGDQKLGEFFVIKGVEEDSDGDVFYEIDGNTTPFAACFSTRMEVFRKSKSSNQLSGLKKVDGPVVGGSVVFAEDFLDTTAGKAYEIIYVYDDNDFRFTDDVGDGHDNKLYWHSPTFYVKEEEPKLSPKPLFAKVNRPNNEPIVGDFIELDSEAAEYSWLSEDKKYEIIDIDEDGDFIFNDDTGEEEWTETNDIKAIYVKYTQEQAEQDANIGDKILIVNPVTSFSSYSEGDILTVEDVGAFGVRNDIFAEELDEGPYLAAREYIVLTDAQIGDLKGEIKSEEYVPQEGDKVRLLSGGGTWPVVGYENGEIYEVVEKRGHNDSPERIQITKDSGRGSGGGFPLISQVEVVEEDSEETLKVGDKVRLLSGGGLKGLLGFEDGEIYKVDGGVGSTGRLPLTSLNGERIGFASPSQIKLLTVEEKTKATSLKGGDYAVILDSAFAGCFDHGDVVRLEKYEEEASVSFDFRGFRVGDEVSEVFDADELRPATREEIAKALGIDSVAVGDKVEILNDRHYSANKGDVLEVEGNDMDIDGKILADGTWISGFYDDAPNFRVVEKAEKVPEASPAPTSSPYGEIKVGDTVKVVIAEGEVPKHDWGRVENGDIGIVNYVGLYGNASVDFPNHSDWMTEASELIKVAENGDLLPETKFEVTETGSITGVVAEIKERLPRCDELGRGKAYYHTNDSGWLGEDQFRVLTKQEAKKHAESDEEVEVTAESPASYGDITVGSLVKVVDDSHSEYGKTLRVVSDNYSESYPFDTEYLNGEIADCFAAEHLELVEEEAAQLKDDSIEVGDLVKVIKSPCALPNGSYFIVKEVESDGRFCSVIGDGTMTMGGYIYEPHHVELIAKADEVYA